MLNLPADCNAVDIGANDGEITNSVYNSSDMNFYVP